MSWLAVKMPSELTLIVMALVAVSVPPVPVLPWSLVTICRVAAPVKVLVGVKIAPLSRRLMFAIVPVNVMVAVDVPLPTEKVRPVVTGRATVPLVAFSWTWTGLLPASTSLIEMGLLVAVENTLSTPFGVCWGPGRLFTGASLTAATLSVTVTMLEFCVPSFAL